MGQKFLHLNKNIPIPALLHYTILSGGYETIKRMYIPTKRSDERTRYRVDDGHGKDQHHPGILHTKWELIEDGLPHTGCLCLGPVRRKVLRWDIRCYGPLRIQTSVLQLTKYNLTLPRTLTDTTQCIHMECKGWVEGIKGLTEKGQVAGCT